MDPLGSRLERLSPEQRRSVEDYIDFLLSRSEPQAERNPPAPPLPVAAPPPLLVITETEQPQLPLPANSQEPGKTGSGDPPHRTATEPPGLREIMTGGEDPLASGYMDYGKFEPPEKVPPSPADEAVRRVKAKLDRKKGEKQADALLEWVE